MDWVRTHFSIPLLAGLAYFKIEIAEWDFFTCLLAITESINQVSILTVILLLLVKRRISSILYDTILKCDFVFSSVLIFDPVSPCLEEIMVKVPQFVRQKFWILLNIFVDQPGAVSLTGSFSSLSQVTKVP